jgi:hypothetical protein
VHNSKETGNAHQDPNHQVKGVLDGFYLGTVSSDLVQSVELLFGKQTVGLKLSLLAGKLASGEKALESLALASLFLILLFLVLDQLCALLLKSLNRLGQVALGSVEVILFHRAGSVDVRAHVIEGVRPHPHR